MLYSWDNVTLLDIQDLKTKQKNKQKNPPNVTFYSKGHWKSVHRKTLKKIGMVFCKLEEG